MELLAFAAERRAAAPRFGARCCWANNISCPRGAQQQTATRRCFGLGDRPVILGVFKPVCQECQALHYTSLTSLSDGCSYGRVEFDL